MDEEGFIKPGTDTEGAVTKTTDPFTTVTLDAGVTPRSIQCGAETWASLTQMGKTFKDGINTAGSVKLNILLKKRSWWLERKSEATVI